MTTTHNSQATETGVPHSLAVDDPSLGRAIERLLRPLASLKVTVVLFAMLIFIILAGTFAQSDVSTRQAINDYFRVKCTGVGDFVRTSYVWVEFQTFFPASFFPSKPQVPGAIPFPKAWLIGFALALNLLAAHLIRFRLQARGQRLLWGLILILAGFGVTWWVIESGSNKSGFQGLPLFDWSVLWVLFLCGLTVLSMLSAAAAFTLIFFPKRRIEQVLLWVLAALAGLLAGWLWWQFVRHGQDARLNDSSMRILWQLAKASAASLVLLAGSMLLFKKRGGVVLMHAGVLLLMFGELLVGVSAREGQMRIVEGQALNYIANIERVELAVVDRSPEDHDKVVAVPRSVLGRGVVEHEELPFKVELVRYLDNATLRGVGPKDSRKNLANAGMGRSLIAQPQKSSAGAKAGGTVDLAAAYVRFTDKKGRVLGTHLLSQIFSLQDTPEKVTVGDKTYDVYLRAHRNYKPYSLNLIDVRKEDYIGTDTPRDYRSIVRLADPHNSVDRKIPIWMNNPMRYAGETFYQSGYGRDPRTGIETTTLAVVTNMGWMIPYTACMVVSWGMIAHFYFVLLRFLHRETAGRTIVRWGFIVGIFVSIPAGIAALLGGRLLQSMREGAQKSELDVTEESSTSRLERMASVWLPLFVVILVGGWLLSKAAPPRTEPDSLELVEFGKLPVVYQGRVKPIDTLARNSLRILRERETFEDKDGDKQPAVRWLLDVMARPDLAFNHRVFRIRNHELLGSLNLEPRKGYWYSAAEIFAEIQELQKQARLAREVEDMSELDRYQRAVLELEKKVGVMDLLYQSYELPRLRPNHLREDVRAMMRRQQELDRRHPPLAIPPVDEAGQWQCYTIAWTKDVLGASIGAGEPNPATDAMSQILAAYARIEPLPDEEDEAGESAGASPAVPSDEDADADESSPGAPDGDVPLPDREEVEAANREAIADFNREVGKYRRYLKSNGPADLNLAKTNFEAYFNHFHPFFYASWAYLVAFVLAVLGWLGWMRPLNRAAFWLIALTLLIHSFALVARVYISGRPPVTNLYSSAVFIGWGCVVMGMLYEPVFRNGIGNIVAAISGFLTLQIAFRLAGDGDTFVVLQAVLDTQFWLATHVVLITLGYSATFVAGAIGILYVVKGIFTPNLTKQEGKELARMIYGTLCFAIYFSFVGTVLGGLWADDSWGRFWGWDPKENGALIIVLWNAVVLHARWGGLVRERGLALLAMGGNIATSWSWFGVNELGVGLHSYGFTQGVLLALLLFGGFNLVVIGLGCIPPQHWWSIRSREPVEPVDAALV